MNCKPGDLAIIVGSRTDLGTHNIGKIVRTVELVRGSVLGLPAWITDPLMCNSVGQEATIGDRYLRPIKDNNQEDETLTWCPLKEPA